MLTAFSSPNVAAMSPDQRGEVVELALLLPKRRAEALMNLARRRHQSVGQVLRNLIEREVTDEHE